MHAKTKIAKSLRSEISLSLPVVLSRKLENAKLSKSHTYTKFRTLFVDYLCKTTSAYFSSGAITIQRRRRHHPRHCHRATIDIAIHMLTKQKHSDRFASIIVLTFFLSSDVCAPVSSYFFLVFLLSPSTFFFYTWAFVSLGFSIVVVAVTAMPLPFLLWFNLMPLV